MKVITKFEIGDMGWYISNNRVNSEKISGVYVSVKGMENNNISIKYTFNSDTEKLEDEIFHSKEELLKSL